MITDALSEKEYTLRSAVRDLDIEDSDYRAKLSLLYKLIDPNFDYDTEHKHACPNRLIEWAEKQGLNTAAIDDEFSLCWT